MKRYLTLLISVLTICIVAPAAGVRFRNIYSSQGLSNNHVNAIFKDADGFMWFGTASGLNRYDGHSMRVFRSHRPDTTALRDNFVQRIQADTLGRMWIYAGDKYSYFDPSTERFHWVTEEEFARMGIPDTPNSLKIAGSDFWAAIHSQGLVKSGGGYALHVPHSDFDNTDVSDIIPDRASGRTYAVTDRGELYVLDYATARIIGRFHNGRVSGTRSDYSMFLDREGLLWIAGVEGLNVFDTRRMMWDGTRYTIAHDSHPVRAVAQDGDGRIWIGYDNEGIEIIDKRSGERQILRHDPGDPNSLCNNSVYALYNDADNGMWVGTYKKGVSVYYPSEYKFDTVRANDVNCIARRGRDGGSAWLGTDAHGLMWLDMATDKVIPVPDVAEPKSRTIVCMAEDAGGTLWLGTYGQGLKSCRDGVYRHYHAAQGLASENVWTLLPNPDGTLWVGTLGGGLQLFNPATGSFKTYTTANSGLVSDYISSVVRGTSGNIYIGTTGGISIYDPVRDEITSQRGTRSGDSPLSSLNVNQLVADRRGLLWIATREGLDVYDIKNDHIYNVVLDEHETNLFILGLVMSPDGSLWITAGSKLYNTTASFDRNAGRYVFKTQVFDEKDGVMSGTFNQRSLCRLPGGEILAGCVNGVLKIDPTRVNFDLRAPRLLFTTLLIGNKPVEIGREYGGRVILPCAMHRMDRLKLSHDQADITVYFAGDNLCNSETTNYEYRLDGLDRQWVACPKGMHHAAYTNLSPGHYTLRVRAVDADGTRIGEVKTLDIDIAAPWWGTWVAKIFYILLAVMALCAIVFYIRRRERSRYRRQQREAIARKHEELNQLKFKFFTNISHELRTPLTLILSPVESMLKECSDERDAKRLTVIRNNASRLLYLVNQLLDFRKNEMAGLTLHPSNGDMVTLLGQICDNFASLTDTRGIRVEFVSAVPTLEMSADFDKISKAVTNLLSNAAKYTPAGGKVTVSLRRSGDNVVIEVADTGKGISDADKAHIFERFYRGSDKGDLNTGSGIGLSLVYEYVKLHGGSVDVRDNTPCGAVFSISIPFKADELAAAPQLAAPVAAITEPAVEAAMADGAADASSGNRPRVLLVDDNLDLTEFLKMELGGEFEVFTASNGLEALQLVKENSFDLIVSDLMMPEMDGIQLCRALKSDERTVNVPLIILSAKQDAGTVVEGLTLGADDYLTKPFNNEVLQLKMRRLIGVYRRGARRSLIEPSPSDISITPLDEQLVNRAVKYVEDNMERSDLTVEEMSRAMGMSRVHLYKKILSITGKTPIEFIRLLRLKRSAQYLRESQLTVAEIAYKTGFNNPKYFSKYFKEEYGMSPSEYQSKEGI